MNKLNENMKALDISKQFKLYIDEESLSLAFKQANDGEFRIVGIKDHRYLVTYKDLSNLINRNMNYMIEVSKEYSFVLVAIKEGENTNTIAQATQSEIETKPEPQQT